MAYTLNGIGAAFYGQRDFREDDTYITTEWIVFLYAPVVPLRSLRVKNTGPGDNRGLIGIGSSVNYLVFEKRFPHWKQVLYTYGYVSLIVSWCYLTGLTALTISPRAFDTASSVAMVLAFCLLPIPTPWVLRHFAKKKMSVRL
jgi:hypothetical protein